MADRDGGRDASKDASTDASTDAQWNLKARGETEQQRHDRNFVELLQELRVAQNGIQLLFGFLLAIAFSAKVEDLRDADRFVYAGTISAAAVAMAMTIGPVALHRATFRRRLKGRIVVISHLMTVGGLTFLFLAALGGVFLAITMVAPDLRDVITVSTAVIFLSVWVIVPLVVRLSARPGENLD
jgi:cation transport ATPase